MSGIKRGSSSSSRTSLEYLQPNLKKQRIEILSFSSTFTSSVISGKQIRVPPSLTKTSEIDGFIENKHSRVRRSCSDHDNDEEKSVSSPAQSDITEHQRSNLGGSDSDCEKRGVDVSDSKAARVEMLKKRFSRIIVKAELLQEGKSVDMKLDDSMKMQMKKKEILMEKKLKEAQIAAEAESKRDIQRKREASRKALLELERTVEVNDNIKTMKDFAVLLGYPPNCAACVRDEVGWYGLCFSTTSRTSDWRKR